MIWEIEHETSGIDGVDEHGRPDPAYAAALGLLRAPWGRRSLAFTCDIVVWLVLQLPLWLGAMPLVFKLVAGSISAYGFVNHPDFVLAVVMASISVGLGLVCGVVQWMLHGLRGTTFGKTLCGIRTVNVRTLERPGVGPVLARFLVVAASALVPVAGPVLVLLSPAFDPAERGRGWHDRLANVWLVDVRAGLNPFDEKRMRIARKTVRAEPPPARPELPSLATPEDATTQSEYRPGGRISAGVLGATRSHEPRAAAVAASGPVAPAQRPVPSSHQIVRDHAGLALRLDTGERIAVSGAILLGRAPDVAGHPGADAVPVADTTRTLSKTHVLVRPVDGGLEVVDCRSTNGCALIRGGVEHALVGGASATAVAGDAIRLGDRIAQVVSA
ncbi:MAG: RDD family protein [Microbacterium sp.]